MRINVNALVFLATCSLGGYLFGDARSALWGLFGGLCVSTFASFWR